MPLYKRRTFSGRVLEQEIFNIAPNTKHLKDAEPKPPPDMTPEQRQAYNDKQALKRMIRNVNNNFGPWAFYVTHTFHDSLLPEDFDEAKPILDNYIRRLQYSFPDMKAIAVMGRGIKTDRIHFHMIVSGVDEATIIKKWKHGDVKRIENLREHNYYKTSTGTFVDHGRDYTGLATYLFLHWTPEQGKGKRWRQTRNIEPPEPEDPTLIKRSYSQAKPPIVRMAGYKLVDFKCTKYGYMYFKYVLLPDDPPHPMTC